MAAVAERHAHAEPTRGSLFPGLIAQDLTHAIRHTGGPTFFVLSSPLCSANEACIDCRGVHVYYAIRSNCPEPGVHHGAAFWPARGPGFIDFSLLGQCDSLFKHTFGDVRPHTAWWWSKSRAVQEAAVPPGGEVWELRGLTVKAHTTGKPYELTVPA